MLRRNVLIFHLGALGDFILTWPFALALSRIYPQSRIIYVTHGEKGQLVEKVLRLESSDVENGWHGLFRDPVTTETPVSEVLRRPGSIVKESGSSEYLRTGVGEKLNALPARIENLVSGAHAVYTFLSPTPEWIANVNRLAPQTKVVAMGARPPEDFHGHASQFLLEQLKDHPIERAATEQILRSVADRGVGFTRAAGSDIVIHPGSGSVAKCWPLEKFLEVAERLSQSGSKVRFLTGEVERERWSSKDFDSLKSIGQWREPKSYMELLSELSTAAMFIGNDSGPGHLAGIIGVPTVSIFTVTQSEQWQPLGPRVRPLIQPGVDEVFKLATGA
jgi:ADP-heptose:LPS heptosyltransferase